MKYIFILILFFCLEVNAQSTSLSFDSIRYTATDILAPGRGANTWYTKYQSYKIPDTTKSVWALDNDTRFLWVDLESTQGNYTWTAFDNEINMSIDSGQSFSFGIMTVCSSCTQYEVGGSIPTASGSYLTYPPYLHTMMQTEGVTDYNVTSFGSHSFWMPNYNSNSYLTRLNALYAAIANHIATGSHNGIPYSKVVYRIDIRGLGDFSEWHWSDWPIPSGTVPTQATMLSVIDMHINNFPNNPLTAIVNAFNTMGGTIPVAVAGYLLTTTNNWGHIGWRSDHIGSTEAFYATYTFNNTNTFAGQPLSSYILNQYKYAPICGEPYSVIPAISDSGMKCAYYNMENEVRQFHYSNYSNIQLSGLSDTCIYHNFLRASKATGYRIKINSGSISSNIDSGNNMGVTLNWQNFGVSPLYFTYQTKFLLKQGSTLKHTYNSSFNPKFFQPSTSATAVTDSLSLNGIAPGNYNLYIILTDSSGYRIPLPLANTNRQTDGSYLVAAITVLPGSGGGGGTGGGGTGGGSNNSNCSNCIRVRKYQKAIIKD